MAQVKPESSKVMCGSTTARYYYADNERPSKLHGIHDLPFGSDPNSRNRWRYDLENLTEQEAKEFVDRFDGFIAWVKNLEEKTVSRSKALETEEVQITQDVQEKQPLQLAYDGFKNIQWKTSK